MAGAGDYGRVRRRDRTAARHPSRGVDVRQRAHQARVIRITRRRKRHRAAPVRRGLLGDLRRRSRPDGSRERGRARAARSPAIGLNILLPYEKGGNAFQDVCVDFRYFFARKMMFVRFASAYVVLPGGFGTLDELSEVPHARADRQEPRAFPIILVGGDFWRGLLDWMRGQARRRRHDRARRDLELMQVIEEPEAIVEAIFDVLREPRLPADARGTREDAESVERAVGRRACSGRRAVALRVECAAQVGNERSRVSVASSLLESARSRPRLTLARSAASPRATPFAQPPPPPPPPPPPLPETAAAARRTRRRSRARAASHDHPPRNRDGRGSARQRRAAYRQGDAARTAGRITWCRTAMGRRSSAATSLDFGAEGADVAAVLVVN